MQHPYWKTVGRVTCAVGPNMEYSYLLSISLASNRIRYLLLQGVAHDTRRVWAFLDHATTILLDIGLACFNVHF